jgi:hypothetical protein
LKNVRTKLLSIFVACIFFLSSVAAVGVPAASALTEEGLEGIEGIPVLIDKFKKLTPEQVKNALTIGQDIIFDSDIIPGILTDDQKANLKSLGLTYDQVKYAYECVIDQLKTDDQIVELQNGNLEAYLEFVNNVSNKFSSEYKENLKNKGVTVSKLVLVALKVSELTFDPYGDIPKADLEKILKEDMGIATETATKYGLNWTNVEALRNKLTNEQKEQFVDILKTIGNLSPQETKKPEANDDTIVLDDATKPVAIDIPAGITDTKIQVPKVGENYQLPLVQVQVQSDTPGAVQGVFMQIPHGTTVTAPDNWDGTIQLPKVKPNAEVSGINGTVSAVVEVGLPDGEIVFDKAVRLVLPGQAGKVAAFKRPGDSGYTVINKTISADYQYVADQELGDREAGKIDVGSDLVIWTKHFTEFIAYTPRSSGGGDGGGGAVTPGTRVVPSQGGTVKYDDAVTLEIPAEALQGTSSVKVLVEKAASPAAAPAGFRILGNVYSITVDGKSHYTFNKPVTLTFTFDPEDLAEGEIPVVYYYDDEASSWVNLGGTVSGNKITVTIDHLTKFAVMAQEYLLNDIAGHWAEDNIKLLVADGAITGYEDGSFKPDSDITRAEFATVLVRALKLEPQSGKIFADTSNHWAKDFIATAAWSGIIQGYDDATFGPDDLITREQMAVMIYRAAQFGISTDEIAFEDAASISSWAEEAVALMAEEGIITGYPDNTFKPQANATRAEAVTVIVRALK